MSSQFSSNLDVVRLNKQIDFSNFLVYNYIKDKEQKRGKQKWQNFQRKILIIFLVDFFTLLFLEWLLEVNL